MPLNPDETGPLAGIVYGGPMDFEKLTAQGELKVVRIRAGKAAELLLVTQARLFVFVGWTAYLLCAAAMLAAPIGGALLFGGFALAFFRYHIDVNVAAVAGACTIGVAGVAVALRALAVALEMLVRAERALNDLQSKRQLSRKMDELLSEELVAMQRRKAQGSDAADETKLHQKGCPCLKCKLADDQRSGGNLYCTRCGEEGHTAESRIGDHVHTHRPPPTTSPTKAPCPDPNCPDCKPTPPGPLA